MYQLFEWMYDPRSGSPLDDSQHLTSTSIFCINRTVMGAQRGGGGYVIIQRVLKVEVHNRLVPVMLLCSNPTYNIDF